MTKIGNLFLLAETQLIKEKAIFYKAVREDLTDFYTGKYQYTMSKGNRNNKLVRDQDLECGAGWHFTNLWEALAFGKDKQQPFKIISAEIGLKDILSVHRKVRVKAFKNVQLVEIKGLL